MITRRVLGTLTTVIVAASLARGASANLLSPGDSGPPDALTAPVPVLDKLLATKTGTFTGKNALNQVRFTGSYIEQVWLAAATPALGTTGTLDFYFQFTNDSSSKDAIQQFSVTDFNVFNAGDPIDVGFVPNAAAALAAPLLALAGTPFAPPFSTTGTALPGTVSRQAGDGAVVDFSFGPGGVAKGTTSQILKIATQATKYGDGTAQWQDGGVAAVIDLGPVPEASTVVGFGSLFGLGGLGMLLRRRNKGAAAA
jgi:hypothetical protein